MRSSDNGHSFSPSVMRWLSSNVRYAGPPLDAHVPNEAGRGPAADPAPVRFAHFLTLRRRAAYAECLVPDLRVRKYATNGASVEREGAIPAVSTLDADSRRDLGDLSRVRLLYR